MLFRSVFSNPISAAAITVNREVAVPVQIADSPFFFTASQEGNPFFLSVGDTFIYNIRFVGNSVQSYNNLGIVSSSFFTPSSRPPGSPPLANTGISSTSVLSFLDQAGNVIFSSNIVTFNDPPLNQGYNSPGRSFGAVDFPSPSLAGITRFSAIRIVGTVDAFSDPSVTALEYDRLSLTLGLNTPVGGVPEPATWAMMLIGFGGIGAAMRTRRKAPKLSFSV